jgi:hypothetical protein
MSQILYTGDDWVVVGTLNNTTLSYALTTEIEVKVIVNGRAVLTLTKTGGQITPTMNSFQFQYTVDKTETEKFKCGTVAFQLSITANGNRQTSTSGEILLKDRK